MAADPQGARASSAERDVTALANVLGVLASKGKASAKEADTLTRLLGKRAKEENKLKKTEELLLAASAKLSETNKKSAATTRSLSEITSAYAAELSKTSKIMTSEVEEAYARNIEGINAMIRARQQELVNGKDVSNELAQLEEKRGNLQFELFQSQTESQKKLGMLAQRTGNRMSGMAQGVSAAFKQHGMKAAEFASKYFGMSAGSLGKVALGAGIFAAALVAVLAVIKRGAMTAMAAAKSGVNLADSFGQATIQGGMLTQAIRRQTYAVGGLAGAWLDEAKALALTQEASQNYAASLFATGDRYGEAIKGGTLAASMAVSSFAVDMAALSTTMGISAEDAVRLGSRLGSLSKAGMKDTERMLLVLSERAKQLMLPLSDLTGVFEQLATSAEFSGESAKFLVNETLRIADSLMAMRDLGVKGLENLSPEKMAKITKGIAGAVTGMSHTRIMALTMKPGGTFNQALESVMEGGVGIRMQALRGLAQKVGLGGLGVEKLSAQQALLFGKAAGVTGEEGDVARMGKFLFGAKGDLSTAAVKDYMSQMTDAKLDSAKSVGAQLQAGADPMQVIANTLRDILRAVIDMVNAFPLASSKFSKETAARLAASYKDTAGGGRTAYSQSMQMTRASVAR